MSDCLVFVLGLIRWSLRARLLGARLRKLPKTGARWGLWTPNDHHEMPGSDAFAGIEVGHGWADGFQPLCFTECKRMQKQFKCPTSAGSQTSAATETSAY